MVLFNKAYSARRGVVSKMITSLYKKHNTMHGHTVRSVFLSFFFFFLVFLSYDKGERYLYMFPPTYHEGTILTNYMSHWHRAIYFIVNLVVC